MALCFPITEEALSLAFQELNPVSIRIDLNKREACVDGTWGLATLRRHIKNLGFFVKGNIDDLSFVDAAGKIELQLHGIDPHPTKNTWRTYYVEVFAR